MKKHLEKINIQINKITYSNIKAILPYLGFALIVLSVKFIIIANYGNATPFWDQWGESDSLYAPLIEGNLAWSKMFSAHNEHRIFTTRILALMVFYFNGIVWNPVLQMQVNAVIHVAALIILIFYVAKALNSVYRNALLLFCTIIFSIPFGWRNLLQGFQSQFYFLLLFSFIFLWSMVAYKTYSRKWWLGIIAGILSFLSLASGAITLIAGAIMLIFRRYIAKEKSDIAISAIFILIIISIISIILTPILPHNAQNKAQSLVQFLFAFANIYSWPAHSIIVGIFIIQIPILILIYRILHKNEYQTKELLFLSTIAIWLFGIFAVTAYSRAIGFSSPKYTDLFAVGLVINFASIAILFDKSKSKEKLFFSAFWGLWIATILLSFECSSEKLSQELKNKFFTSLEQEENVRAYLCTGDVSHLQNKPLFHIPFPKYIYLKKLLDNATIRSFLPGNIYGPNSSNPTTFCNEYKNEKPLHSLKVTVAKTCIGSINTINNKILPKQFAISGTLNISGWLAQSPMKSLPAVQSAIVILTDSTGKNLFFRTQKHHRPGVATHYKNPALSETGFRTIINVSLMAGNYTLGLGFVEGEKINICPQFKIPGTITKKINS